MQVLRRVTNADAAGPDFLSCVEALFAGMDVAQIRHFECVEQLGRISHVYAEACRHQGKPGRGIPHLVWAHSLSATPTHPPTHPQLHGIQRLRPSPDHLTPLDCDYLCLCLLQKQYTLASDRLADTVYDVSAAQSGTTPRDFMLYYYYGGLVYLGLREHAKAYAFLETCICCPATCLSAVVVEAHKKMLMVSLLHTGTPYCFSKQCPPAVTKCVGRYCAEYLDVCSAWEGTGAKDSRAPAEVVANLRTVIERHGATFTADRNLGLVKQVLKAYVRRAISRLTVTHESLSLKDIASEVGLSSAEEAESYLVAMVAQGQVRARISEENQMAHFIDASTSDSASSTAIAAEMGTLKQLLDRVGKIDATLKCAKGMSSRSRVVSRTPPPPPLHTVVKQHAGEQGADQLTKMGQGDKSKKVCVALHVFHTHPHTF